MNVCRECAARSVLVASLAGRIEILRRQRRYVRSVLALDNEALVHAVGAPNHLPSPEQALEGLASAVERAGTTAVCACHASYPDRLRDCPDRPAVIYASGADTELTRHVSGAIPAVAIVGARRASGDGVQVARDLGRGLSAAGVTVVSGMALGIDSAAHEGALAAGALTTAVLAGPAHVAYPRSKAAVHRELLQRAVVVSEMPPDSTAFAWNFLARNRIIAGLAQITVVVEAAERSGSLVTAEMALDAGSEVGAVPGSPLNWRSAGTNELLRDGAVLVRDAQDVIDRLAELDLQPAAPTQLTLTGLSDAAKAVLDDVEAGRGSVALLAEQHGGVGQAQAALTELELAGHVSRLAGGRVVAHTTRI